MELIKVTTYCSDTRFQTFSPLMINRSVQHAVHLSAGIQLVSQQIAATTHPQIEYI